MLPPRLLRSIRRPLRSRYSAHAGVAFALALGALAACAPSTDEGGASASELGTSSKQWATKDWSNRDDWYEPTQGSQIIDYAVFRAIERDDAAEPFSSRESLERYGFEYPPDGYAHTTDGLPLGVMKDNDSVSKRDYVGLSCPACHTGALDIDGKRLLVEGGQSWLDYVGFLAGISKAVDASIADSDKRGRVCAKLGSDCDTKLDEAKKAMDAHFARNPVAVATGPGRADAITQILNEVFSDQVSNQPPQAHAVPVSIPPVWDAPRLRCVQTNCLSMNPSSRNIGEVLGVHGQSSLRKVDGKLVVVGTPKVDQLHQLESSLLSLDSPKWNESLMGKLDEAKRSAGEKLFAAKCSGCHAEPYKPNAPDAAFEFEDSGTGKTNKLWRVTTKDYREVGTDPSFIEVHGSRWVDDGVVSDFFDQMLRLKVANKLGKDPNKLIDGAIVTAAAQVMKLKFIHQGHRKLNGNMKALLALGAVVAGVENSFIASKESDPAKQKALKAEFNFDRNPPSDIELAHYRARPLNGIAFTAPYGHNGAWPSLREMFKKPEQRVKRFVVRPRSFDATNVGLDVSPATSGEKLFEFDATKQGNLNGGHLWGTDLGESEKDSLFEYLKSI